MRCLVLFVFLAASCVSGAARAGIIFNVAGFDSDVLNNGVIVTQGTTGAVIPVYISTDDSSQLDSFNLVVDVSAVSSATNPGPDGQGLPALLSFNPIPITLGAQGGTLGPNDGLGLNTNFNSVVDIDGLINIDSFSTTPSSPTVGFNVVFDVGNVAPGRYWINLDDTTNTDPDLASVIASGGNNMVTFSGGYINVIPEPGSTGLIAVCTLMLASVRRRKA